MKKCARDLDCVRFRNGQYVCAGDWLPIREGATCIFHQRPSNYCYQCEHAERNFELAVTFCRLDFCEKRETDTCEHFQRVRPKWE